MPPVSALMDKYNLKFSFSVSDEDQGIDYSCDCPEGFHPVYEADGDCVCLSGIFDPQ